jgi:hypothetical protein
VADRPEDFAFERDGGEATDGVERVAADARDILGDQHFGNAVAVEVAEADVAARSEASSASRAAMRCRIPAFTESDAVAAKFWKRAGEPAITPALPLRISLSSA